MSGIYTHGDILERLAALERAAHDERKERLRLEKQLHDEAIAREALDRELHSKARQLDIAIKTLGGWKGEVRGLREEMAAMGERVHKQLADHKDSLNAMLDMIEDTVSVSQVQELISQRVAVEGGHDRGSEARELAAVSEVRYLATSGLDICCSCRLLLSATQARVRRNLFHLLAGCGAASGGNGQYDRAHE